MSLRRRGSRPTDQLFVCYFAVKGNLTPLPRNAELWMGAMSEPGIRRAARFGCPWPTDPLLENTLVTSFSAAHAPGTQVGSEG